MKRLLLLLILFPRFLFAEEATLMLDPYDFRHSADQEQFSSAIKTITTKLFLYEYDKELRDTDLPELISLEAHPFDGLIIIKAKDSRHPGIAEFVANNFLSKIEGEEIDARFQRIDALQPRMDELRSKIASMNRTDPEYEFLILEYQGILRKMRSITLSRTSNYTWTLIESQP